MVKDTSPNTILLVVDESEQDEGKNFTERNRQQQHLELQSTSTTTIRTPPTTSTSKIQSKDTFVEEPIEDSECTDQYRNCPLVVQARLCRYKYYRSVCCNACDAPHPDLLKS